MGHSIIKKSTFKGPCPNGEFHNPGNGNCVTECPCGTYYGYGYYKYYGYFSTCENGNVTLVLFVDEHSQFFLPF